MIANSIFAAGAFVSLVAAVPMAQPPFPKRDVVWETQTDVAYTTIPVTVTHWLEPGETAPAVGKQHYGHMAHGYGHSQSGYQPPAQPETTATSAPAPPVSSPSSAPSAPAPSSYEQPTSAPAPPPAPTSQAPTPEQPTQPAYTPEPQPTPTPSSQPQPQPSQPSSGGSSSGSAPSGKEYTGDITHYSVGLGSCGTTHTDSEAVVAIPEGIMNNPANPNANPLCGQTITISYAGQEHTAEIVDTCGGCYATSIDLSPTLFEAVAPNGDGRVSDVKWWFNGN